MTGIRSTDPSMIIDRRTDPKRHGNLQGSKGRGSDLWGAGRSMQRKTPKVPAPNAKQRGR